MDGSTNLLVSDVSLLEPANLAHGLAHRAAKLSSVQLLKVMLEKTEAVIKRVRTYVCPLHQVLTRARMLQLHLHLPHFLSIRVSSR